MDLSDDDLERFVAADRREVDPPVRVETATWSRAGQLDWWVLERRPRWEWWVRYAVRRVGNGGSELVIFVPEARP
jgi:hypothetical protein